MGVQIEIALPGQAQPDVLALPVTDPVDLGGDAARIVEDKLGGRLARLAETGELSGKTGRALLLHLAGELQAPRLVIAGLGPRTELSIDSFRTAGAAAARAAAHAGGTVLWLVDESLGLPVADQVRGLVEGTVFGTYDPGRWKTSAENGARKLEKIVIGAEPNDALRRTAERAALVAERANRARDLANAPPNELTPATLAEHASQLADQHEHLTAEALEPDRIEELGMGALEAVGRGSVNEPRLIVLRYEPPQPAQPDVVLGLVGKAITFDSGGLSIKPATSMQDMKGDMSGGAGVIEGIGAIAALGLPVRAIAVVAAAENAVGSTAFRPGDILRSGSGKTIEITNTDAEGRLVLADALWYARREGATHVVDVATLTGAMELALGDLYAGVFSNDDEWRDRLLAAGDRSGDLLWPFPLHERYRRYVDSTYADLKNSSDLRQGSPALAAEFLREFAGEGPWAHIDMAGPAFLERPRGDYLDQPGGTGWGVRLIVELATSLS